MDKPTRELAIVTKALEIRAVRQETDIQNLLESADEALAQIREIRRATEHLTGLIDDASDNEVHPIRGVETSSPQSFISSEGSSSLPTAYSWEKTVAEAESILREEGVDPASVAVETPGALDTVDVVASLSFGALGAVLPSIGGKHGLVNDAFHKIQKAADAQELPSLVQKVFGDHPAPFMDEGPNGIYHRFVHGHDLLSALPKGIRQFGFLQGVTEVFQHILRDSFGRTGIPLPGSQLIGNAIARVLGKGSLTDLIRPRDLSRFTGVRMVDGVSTGTTCLLLWIYRHVREIPSPSIRAAKLGILAHGLCFVGVAVAATIPGLHAMFPYRSHLNHVSLTAMLSNAVQLHRLTVALAKENTERRPELDRAIQQLVDLRQQSVTEDMIDAELRRVAVAAAQ